MHGEILITQLLVTSSTVSFLCSKSVTSELFSGEKLQYSHRYDYVQTYIVHDNIPEGMDQCIIKLFDGINRYSKIIELNR